MQSCEHFNSDSRRIVRGTPSRSARCLSRSLRPSRGGPNSLEPSARPLVPNDLLDYALATARIPQHCRQAALDIFFGCRP